MRRRSCTGRSGGRSETVLRRNAIANVARRIWPGDVGVNRDIVVLERIAATERARSRFCVATTAIRGICRGAGARPAASRASGKGTVCAPVLSANPRTRLQNPSKILGTTDRFGWTPVLPVRGDTGTTPHRVCLRPASVQGDVWRFPPRRGTGAGPGRNAHSLPSRRHSRCAAVDARIVGISCLVLTGDAQGH